VALVACAAAGAAGGARAMVEIADAARPSQLASAFAAYAGW